MTIYSQEGQEAPSYKEFLSDEAGRQREIAKYAGRASLNSPTPTTEAQPPLEAPQINE